MPDLPGDSSVRKIRSLCQELAESYRLDNETRDELCAHLEDKLTGYLSGEVRITEEDALQLVRVHFGNAEQIARRLGRDRSFFRWGLDHNRVYILLLIAIAIIPAVNLPYVLRMAFSPDTPGIRKEHLPNVVLRWDIPLGICYLTAAIAMLWFRRFRPAAARRFTRILNYLLLFAPPLGTLLGIYGLLKVDKQIGYAVQGVS